MRNLIRDYFYYSRLERNGILVLSFLCMFFFLFPKLYKQSKTQSKTDFSHFNEEITTFENALQNVEVESMVPSTEDLFKFDPNTVTESELQELGLSSKVIRTFLNFRSKGGKFYKKEDFKKVYGITENEYFRLENYIEIHSGGNNFSQTNKEYSKTKEEIFEPFEFDPNFVSQEDLEKLGFSTKAANNLIKFRQKGGTFRHKDELSKIYGVDEILFEKLYTFITFKEKSKVKNQLNENEKTVNKTTIKEIDFVLDINTATDIDLQKIYGIGPYYAKSIINFRTNLGGFYSIDQIGETYNFPDSTFQMLKPYLKLNTPPKKINLNIISVEELAKHPYLKFKEAKVIINYRNQHGAFSDLNELEKIIALKPALISKMKPYLFVE
jgi:DNA uptake protein ComE-like DNA-binding protein